MNITNDNYPKVDANLEENGKLMFVFPNPDGGPSYYRSCPFFQNPTIKESQAASLIQYQPIGRAGTLFGYTGAQSRNFEVTFKITLPLLIQLSQSISYANDRPSELSKAEQARSFFIDGGSEALFEEEVKSTSFSHFRDVFTNDLGSMINGRFIPNAFGGKKLHDMYGDSLGFPGIDESTSKTYVGVINLMLYWATLIRSSVSTYSPNPSVGPPIVRLSFGIMYQDIPTVVSKYSISVDDSAGYDVISLMPRQYSVSLSMSEVRESRTDGFEAGNAITRDQLVGWEQVIGRTSRKTTDPGSV